MIHQIDAVWWHILNGGLRWTLAHGGHRLFPLMPLVNEYPKSGGSWLAQMLASALHIPFPRNRLPMFRSSILQGHYMRRPGMGNVIAVWRDGRDVMISWYFHRVVGHELSSNRQAERIRKLLDIDDALDIEAYLPRFLEFCFTKPKHPSFTWPQFVADWQGQPWIVETSYERLHHGAAAELSRIVAALTGRELDRSTAEEISSQYSFERQSGRSTGHERADRFLRKGIIGDWRSKFTPEARQIFHHFAGRALIALSYEADGSWVEQTN